MSRGPAGSRTHEVFDLVCPECGAGMTLRDGRFGKFYACNRFCGCTHGARSDGAPLGIPGDRATKDARIRAHAVFDTLWKKGPLKLMSRREAYRWMEAALGLPRHDAHIGMFSAGVCSQLVEAVLAFRWRPNLPEHRFTTAALLRLRQPVPAGLFSRRADRLLERREDR